MNLEERKKNIPEEFKQLAQDFSDNGFITTSLDNLVNWARTGSLPVSYTHLTLPTNSSV